MMDKKEILITETLDILNNEFKYRIDLNKFRKIFKKRTDIIPQAYLLLEYVISDTFAIKYNDYCFLFVSHQPWDTLDREYKLVDVSRLEKGDDIKWIN